MASRYSVIAGVDIGTSKIAVAVQARGRRRTQIIGMAESPCSGMKEGSIADPQLVIGALEHALLSAERSAGVPISRIVLSQSGTHLTGISSAATVNLGEPDHAITRKDMDLVCRLATSREVPADQIEIHSILRGFRLDGSKLRASAEHLRARRLKAEYWIVQGKESEVAEGIYLIKKLWRSTEDLLLSSMASALAVTTHAEREAGILIIDIGAACSDYVIYRGGRVLMTGVVAFGGDNINIALAQTCDLTTCEAEQLKLAYGSAGCSDDHNSDSGGLALSKKQSELVRSSISKPLVHQLLGSVIRTMFLCVKHRHVSALTSLGIPAGVVLTGGTSNLPGINDVAAEVFGVSSRIGHPTTEHPFLNAPRYATVVGLVQMNNS